MPDRQSNRHSEGYQAAYHAARARALKRLIVAHREEYERLLAEERAKGV